ncbi:hypothetical protein [uncultured Jannaschia sp.]|uniref:hypothetical protein n=1 Tax=uncultured Jannaschia sp. TaxID=293347 RepID=UPI002623E2C9|nr:hypothetical protein [uncultured Jannaschia sp.]
MDRQGQHGEALFAALCSDPSSAVGAVLNPSINDQHGWDHIVEIESDIKLELPADMRAPVLTCFAQIKTTRKRNPVTKVKLSNALKAATSAAPCFVFLFHYDRHGVPVLYGRHLWTDDIAFILKRARQAGQEPLHRKHVSFAFDDADRIETAPQEWILERLAGQGGLNYATEKSRIVDSVGYDADRFRASFEIDPDLTGEDLVLNQVGLRDRFPVRNLRIDDIRFGIAATTTWIKEGEVSISPSGHTVTCELRSSSDEVLRFPAHAIMPAVILETHPSFLLRVRAGPLDIVCRPHTVTSVNLDVDIGTRHALAAQAALLAILDWGSCDPVEFRIDGEVGCISRGRVEIAGSVHDGLRRLADCARYATMLLGDERAGQLDISLDELGPAMEDAQRLAVIHCHDYLSIRTLTDPVIPRFDALLGYSYGRIGHWSYGAIHQIDLKDVRDVDGRKHFEFGRAKIVRTRVYRQSLEFVRAEIERDFEAVVSRRTDRVGRLSDGNLLAWLRDWTDGSEILFRIED